MPRYLLPPQALFLLLVAWVLGAIPASGESPLERDFRQPPLEARPWVYWFWLNGNITSNGITADLEAMKRVGIGGVLIMEVDQGAPVGPVDFMSPQWRALFQHVHQEARRLGLEVNMNNDAGWNGSGGPWIRPEQAMQEVVWSEVTVEGPQKFQGQLPQPPTKAGYYRDISVMAFPTTDDYRIPDFESKAGFQTRGRPKPGNDVDSEKQIITSASIKNLTRQTDAQGKLTWEVPAGNWTIVRFGHTCTGVENAPAPASGRGLECDKLSAEGIRANFAGMMAPLVADNGGHSASAGLVATHIDSWENGSQNWSPKMREEFRARRGYDLFAYFPVLTGRVVENEQVSERFLRDVRQTISELIIDNYAGQMRELAHAAGLRFTVEAYGGPCDAIPYAGRSDEPMGEFWTPDHMAIETCKGMASAGHIYGKRIIGAEAFTSGNQERWLEHPALLKPHGDLAFCEGINRFVFHRYALQPWAEERVPGMMMGPWGQHYERTQTWWEWTAEWHTYLARCQYLLRQGHYVADICYVQPETPPQGPGNHPRRGYSWDECTAEAVIDRMSFQNGYLTLPDGMRYRLLALPSSTTMTPELLRKVRSLVEAGALVLGPKPVASPSLSGYPQCDSEVKMLAGHLWGDEGENMNRFGAGHVAWSRHFASPEALLSACGLQPDFTSSQPLRFIHRRAGEMDLYFVANSQRAAFTATCNFRVAGKVPELWWPHNGRSERAAVWQSQGGVTQVAIPFEACGSVFVVFRDAAPAGDPVVQVLRNGASLLSAKVEPPPRIEVIKATYGVPGDAAHTRDVRVQVQQLLDSGLTCFAVRTIAESGDPAYGTVKTLAVDYEVQGQRGHVAGTDPEMVYFQRQPMSVHVVKARYGLLDDPARTRDVRAKLQALLDSGHAEFRVAAMADGDDPAFGIVKTLEVEFVLDGKPYQWSGHDPDLVELAAYTAPIPTPVEVRCDAQGNSILRASEPGQYEWVTASGKKSAVRIDSFPAPKLLTGPWRVEFQPKRGAPKAAVLDQLISWSQHPDPGVKYFSGEAVYQQKFTVPAEMRAKDTQVLLELGSVQVMAEVQLNGKTLATLWRPPYLVDITGALKNGENQLRIRVVNLWPNRLIGDEQLPADCERNNDGTLKQWPDWVQAGRPSPTGRITFADWRLWNKNDALQESGLIGPVTLRAVKQLAAAAP